MAENSPLTLWLTGLPCSGKSTLATLLQNSLVGSVILDGDVVRKTLCSDLGFSVSDRCENIRRVGSICRLLNDQRVLVIAAFVSPTQVIRDLARSVVGRGFKEVYLSCSLSICEKRDVKGMYAAARRGDLPEFTGVTAEYEPPATPDICVDTENLSPTQSVSAILSQLGTA